MERIRQASVVERICLLAAVLLVACSQRGLQPLNVVQVLSVEEPIEDIKVLASNSVALVSGKLLILLGQDGHEITRVSLPEEGVAIEPIDDETLFVGGLRGGLFRVDVLDRRIETLQEHEFLQDPVGAVVYLPETQAVIASRGAGRITVFERGGQLNFEVPGDYITVLHSGGSNRVYGGTSNFRGSGADQSLWCFDLKSLGLRWSRPSSQVGAIAAVPGSEDIVAGVRGAVLRLDGGSGELIRERKLANNETPMFLNFLDERYLLVPVSPYRIELWQAETLKPTGKWIDQSMHRCVVAKPGLAYWTLPSERFRLFRGEIRAFGNSR